MKALLVEKSRHTGRNKTSGSGNQYSRVCIHKIVEQKYHNLKEFSLFHTTQIDSLYEDCFLLKFDYPDLNIRFTSNFYQRK